VIYDYRNKPQLTTYEYLPTSITKTKEKKKKKPGPYKRFSSDKNALIIIITISIKKQ